jgi:predicted ribosome quality control (RQC) complex YloA/Tae2 family protein
MKKEKAGKIKFREFETSLGTMVYAGKDESSNEKVVEQALPQELLIHTEAPGSPFCNIKSNNPTQEDIYEAAVFCAKYSQAWKKAKKKKDVPMNVFYKRDTNKEKGMKTGCFGVSKMKKLIIKKEDIEEFEKDLNDAKKCIDEEKNEN